MSFVDGFFGFSLAISDSARGVYESVRVKTPKHPSESMEYLTARVLTFAHQYQEGLEFSQGLFEPKEPTLWLRDVVGEITLWVEVGLPSKEKIQRVLRHKTRRLFVYFTGQDQIPLFCQYLRGSTTNWASTISFFQFDFEALTKIAAALKSNNRWNVTIADETVYVQTDEGESQFELPQIDIWAEYQKSLAA